MLKSWLRNNTFKVLIILGIILKITLILQPAHSYDIGTFHSWGINIFKLTPANFFDKIWTDYLPLPLYLLGLTSKLSTLLGMSFELTFKIIVSLIEVLLIYLSYKLTKSKKLFLFLFLSPALFINSSLWGQVDTIVSLALILSLLYLNDKNWPVSAIIYGLAVAFKPIAILTLPVFAILSIKNRSFLKFSILSFFTFLLTAFPVVYKSSNLITLIPNSFMFLLEQASYQSSVYPFTTINAFNFWAVGGKNWVTDQTSVLGITSQTLGYTLFAAFLFPILRKISKSATLINLSFSASLILITFYTFTTRMHERHLIYGLPFLLLASLSRKKLTKFYVLFSALYSINLYAAYYWLFHEQVWPLSLSTIQGLSLLLVITVIILFVKYLKPNFQKIKDYFKSNKLLIPVITLALFLRLVNLSHPKEMIFDEVYHAFTAKEMFVGNVKAWQWWNTPPEGYAYEWTHPPLAKYGMVFGMLLFGPNSFGWRFASAVVGTISIWLVYEIAKYLTRSRKTAILAAFFLSIEGLHLVQSRVAMNDLYMIAFMLASLLLAQKNRWKLSALAFGFSLSSKWSALYTLIPLAYIYLTSHKLTLKSALNAIRLVLISAIVYILLYTPFFLSGHDYTQFIELHRQMWYYHTHLDATHGYQSQPHQWILALRPVWYYVSYAKDTIANIYAHSNPLILWLGLIAIADTVRKRDKALTLAYIGYLSFTLPWVISPRIMFMYHYLPSITFLVIILSSWVRSLNKKYTLLVVIASIISFLLLLPLYYGFPIGKDYWDTLFTLFPYWK